MNLLYLRRQSVSEPMNKSIFEIRRWLSLGFLIAAAFVSASAQTPAPAPKASPTPRAPRAPKPPDVYVRAEKAPVDSSVADDPAVNQMLVAYSPKVRELDTVLGSLKGELRKGGMGAGSLGNFVSDGMRWQAGLKLGQPIDLALINGGGLRRSTISEGELRARDIFELLPFENALVRVDLTGEQLMRLLKLVVASREAQSGARIVYFTKPDKTSDIATVKMRTPGGEKDIDPQATYRIVTIDYIVNRGGDISAVLKEGKDRQPLGITLRDAIMAYVKSETAAGRIIKANLDGRFWLDRTKSAVTEETPPQSR
jgi:2',3'-cyclic-nucleotide 2'-phosphodiesterase (5'-nucleotidase family)